MTRRKFLINAYKIGGLAALWSLGVSRVEASSLIGSGIAASVGCSGYTTSETLGDGGSTQSISQSSTDRYRASRFVPTSDISLGRIGIRIRRVGSPTYNLTLEIYDGDASNPGSTLLATGNATIDSSTVPTSATVYDVVLDGAIDIVTTGYYYVVYNADAEGDGSNKLQFDSGSGGRILQSADKSSWSYDSASYGYARLDTCD